MLDTSKITALLREEMAEQAGWAREPITDWRKWLGDPRNETPEGGTQETTDWQKRYSDLQPEFTRATQRVSELERYESDEQAFLELARKHGYELTEAEEEALAGGGLQEAGGVDPNLTAVLQRLDAIDQRVTQNEGRWEQTDVQRGRQQFDADLDGWAKESDVELDDYDRAAILQKTLDADQPGPEAAKAAFDQFAEHVKTREQRTIDKHIEGKRRAPRPGVGGQTGTEVRDPADMSRQELNQWMTERAAQLDAA